MRESRQPLKNWIPAFAGMTNSVVFDLKKIKPIGKQYKTVFIQPLNHAGGTTGRSKGAAGNRRGLRLEPVVVA